MIKMHYEKVLLDLILPAPQVSRESDKSRQARRFVFQEERDKCTTILTNFTFAIGYFRKVQEISYIVKEDEEDMNLLIESRIWSIDGTFKSGVLLVVYAFLPHKRRNIYSRLAKGEENVPLHNDPMEEVKPATDEDSESSYEPSTSSNEDGSDNELNQKDNDDSNRTDTEDDPSFIHLLE
ncbi:hypothetical protein FQA39_LY02049 [Lamprigera yunnana]|nr:hypothetical protein FQA39_LY02049 [Lamprigera yunnana]